MLSLSQTTGYAIRALICLPACQQPPRLVAEVARCTGIPRAYLAKIIHRLARRGLVAARRGHRGGITLARPAGAISLLDVVEAVEGPNWLGRCLLGLEECQNQQECPTHEFWRETCARIRDKLATTSLAAIIAVYPHKPECGPHAAPAAQPARRGRGLKNGRPAAQRRRGARAGRAS